MAQPNAYKMERRQDLEILERAGGLSPLLCGQEAVALMRNGKREVGALTYGALTGVRIDPTL